MAVLRKTVRLLSVVLITLFVLSCTKEEPPPTKIVRPVRTMEVYSTGGIRVRTFSGTAQAGVESKLSFKVPGTLQRFYVKVGEKVRAGYILANLDETDYKLAVQETEASLKRAQAQSRNAKARYDRVRDLYENQNASRSELDAARAGAESAEAEVQAMEKRLERSETQLTYTQLIAQVDGAVSSIIAEVNENVKTGQEVLTLASGRKTEVQVGVPEILISGIREGSTVKVTFDAIAGKSFDAVVTEVGIATGAASTYPVTVRLSRQDPSIRQGMAAEVAFTFRSRGGRERMIVPTYAVGEDRQGRFVYVVTPTGEGLGVAKRRPVTVGELIKEGIEVIEGLSDGELVVTAGVSRITDGLEVKLLEGAGASP